MDDGGPPEKAYGPYPEDRGGTTKWRVVVVGHGGRRSSRLYETEEAAEAVVKSAQRKVGTASVGNLLALYVDALRLKGIKARSLSTTEHRLTRLIKPVHDAPVTSLTQSAATKLYLKLASQVAVDTHRNTLGQARTWFRWAVKKGHVKVNPWLGVEGIGERSYGKDQLRIDEARKLWRYIRGRIDQGSVATAVVMLLGLRASEVVAIVARDVDASGTILWIPRGKTKQAKRQLLIPTPLQPKLVAMAADGGRLFPHRREWVLDVVKRRAKQAGLEGNITAHGLRGLHATLKVEYEAAQRDLGHRAGTNVTEKHYLQPGTIERATARRVWEVLDE